MTMTSAMSGTTAGTAHVTTRSPARMSVPSMRSFVTPRTTASRSYDTVVGAPGIQGVEGSGVSGGGGADLVVERHAWPLASSAAAWAESRSSLSTWARYSDSDTPCTAIHASG